MNQRRFILPVHALRHRNFRLLWLGLLVSFSGSYMQSAAILWHVSLLVPDNRRAIALGMVGLVRVIPIVVFSLISGVAADALDRRKLMLVTQSSMAAIAAALFLVTFHGLTAVWPIYALAAASSRWPVTDSTPGGASPRQTGATGSALERTGFLIWLIAISRRRSRH